MLNIPYIQSSISKVVTAELSNRIGVPIKVGKIDIEWFNRIAINDLYLEDQDGKMLFMANHVSTGFEVVPLLNGKLTFSSVRLFGFSLNLKKEKPDSKLNLQFVIDAFASKDTTPTNLIDLRFNTILIRKGHLSYDVESESKTSGKFNGRHVDVRNISANISVKAFGKDSLNAYIKKLSFEESSGFSLNKLSLAIVGNKDSATVSDFEIKLPKTDLKLANTKILLSKIHNTADLINNAPLSLNVLPSKICLQDISAFVPVFKNFSDEIEMSANASGYINDINLDRLTLKYSDKMLFVGAMQLKGITHLEDAYLFGKVNKMYITTEGIKGLINNFNKQANSIPDALTKIGTINFTGEISGFFDNLVAFGKFSSSIGSIQTDIIFGSNKEKHTAAYLKGRVQTSELKINQLFDEGNPYGNVRFNIDINMTKPEGGHFAGKIKANIDKFDYKGYQYKNAFIAGDFKKGTFQGSLNINDPNGILNAEGSVEQNGKNSLYNFTARLENLRLDKLNLTDYFESPEISSSFKADFKGNTIDNLEGNISIDSLSFRTAPDSFFLKQLRINATGHPDKRNLTISSDVINGEVEGQYSFATIIPSLMNTFKGYLPALINATYKDEKTQENIFNLTLRIDNLEKITKTLKIPFIVQELTTINGHYDNLSNKFYLEATLPKFSINNSHFKSGFLTCQNPDDKAKIELKAAHYNKQGVINHIAMEAEAKDDQMNTYFHWSNNKDRLYKADLSASSVFVEESSDKSSSSLRTEISVQPTSFIIKDTVWNIEPSAITIHKGKVDIDHFSVSRQNQHVQLNGAISKSLSDTLLVDLDNIELSYIFDILNIPVLQFGGKATGSFRINDLFESRKLSTDLEIKDFSFNQVPLGRLNIFSEWDEMQKGILMLGSIYKNDSTWTDVNGYVFPVGENAGLSLYFDANDLNISFIQPFIKNVIKGLKGQAFGNIHLHGPFKKLNVEGDAFIKDGGVGVDFTDTYYTFSDSIHLDSTSIKTRDLGISDVYGNTGKINMNIQHRHFHDFIYELSAGVNNMLVYNVPERKNPSIYGPIFGSGTLNLKGNSQVINLDVNIRSEAKTALKLNFMNASTATEYDFITFIKKGESLNSAQLDLQTGTYSQKPEEKEKEKEEDNDDDEGAELRTNFLLEINPESNIEMVMDPYTGDRIKANCSGTLQVQYGTKTDLRMYGGLNIVKGNYNFSLQKIIHKDFKIREGSVIDFRGSPTDATLNMNAIYSLTANLSDLDETLAKESPRTNVPVNCVLKLDGMLRNPAISFDLEMPGANSELERQMKSLIDTQDMMTRQIVYLLVLSKFYTPDNSSNINKSNDFTAAASSALSSQISSILNSLTDKVQIGTNIRAGTGSVGFEDTEVEMMLSSQLLNNRLLINGNFGYKNNTLQKNAFIGEFDLEYKLTKSGEIRLKAYNHANDMYQILHQSLTTQGVGLLYKKDFTDFSDIFRRKRKHIGIPQTQPAQNKKK